jgi:magnesium transporter
MSSAEVAREEEPFPAEDLREVWSLLDPTERLEAFRLLARPEAEDFFLGLAAADQVALLLRLVPPERRSWIRLLAPDDVVDLIQAAPPGEQAGLVALLDETTKKEVPALLAFAEDDAGGLMNPRYARVRPDMTVDEALLYVRRQIRERAASSYYAYVLDAEQRLLGVVSFGELFAAPGDKRVRDVMKTEVVVVPETMDQEAVGRLLAEHDLLAIPVVDDAGRMKGIVTADDIMDVVEEEATEDIQKIGGTSALDAPYLRTPFHRMVGKRAGWLSILFMGEMLTATAMAYFEEEIRQAVVLAVFIPLIISSGGNSGSQASTLVIRAMALGEVGPRDWWRVLRRELGAGFALGAILGLIGVARILFWHQISGAYGEHYVGVAITIALSVLGVVTWGAIAGSMLPFVLRKLRLDPASASAPFVATLVDVSGLVIYFTAASLVLSGTLL